MKVTKLPTFKLQANNVKIFDQSSTDIVQQLQETGDDW